MQCPYFTVLEFGIFDSNVKFPKMITTSQRQSDCYELEFHAVDSPGQTYLNGQWYPLLHGTFVCAKPGAVRKSLLPFKCYYIHIQTQDPTLLSMLDRLPDLFTLLQVREVVQIWNEMLTLDPSQRPEERLLLESCVCRIIYLIYRHRHIARDTKADRVFLHQKNLLAIEQYIREHLSEALSLNALADLCNLSPTYFHSVFTDFFHKTPAQYILDCRIHAAKTGLLTGEYSLTELAADCGFSSQSYFCYKFKQVTGQSPLQYRKEKLGSLNI